MRRTILLTAWAGAVVLALAGCQGSSGEVTATVSGDLVAAAMSEGEVVVYHGYLDAAAAAIKEGFEEAYPGITVTMEPRMSTSELAQRIDADVRSTGRIQADWATASDTALLDYLAEEGLSEPVSTTEFPGVDEAFQVGTNAVAISIGVHAIGYNTAVLDRVGADPIDSWDDLLQPELDGLVMIADPEGSAAWGNAWSEILRSDLGEDFVSELGSAGFQPVASSLVGVEQLVAAQGAVLLFGVPVQFDDAAAEGAPIEFWFPEDPAPLHLTNAFLPSGAEHPNAAKLFLKWMLSPQGQEISNSAAGQAAVLPGIPNTYPQPAQLTRLPTPDELTQDVPAVKALLKW
ncbi:MAG: extracellular solute-binding protein [Microbacterium sp.]